MGFSADMQGRLKYMNSLRKKKNFYQNKIFDPKWGKEKRFELKKPLKQFSVTNKNTNQAYIEEMKKKQNWLGCRHFRCVCCYLFNHKINRLIFINIFNLAKKKSSYE